MKDTLKKLEEASARLDAAMHEGAILLGHDTLISEPPAQIGKGRVNVTRAEFERLVQIVTRRTPLLERILRDLTVQFTRLAQLQADVDLLQRRCDQRDAARQRSATRRQPRKRPVR